MGRITNRSLWACVGYLIAANIESTVQAQIQPTFDCNAATLIVETLICNNSALADLDLKLGRIYKQILEQSSDTANIKAEQRAWIKKRNSCQTQSCVQQSYEARISDLASTLNSSGSERDGSQNVEEATAEEVENLFIVKLPAGSNSLNLRSAPGTENPIIERLNNGTAVTVLEKRPDGWWRVAVAAPNLTTSGNEGWLLSSRDGVSNLTRVLDEFTTPAAKATGTEQNGESSEQNTKVGVPADNQGRLTTNAAIAELNRATDANSGIEATNSAPSKNVQSDAATEAPPPQGEDERNAIAQNCQYPSKEPAKCEEMTRAYLAQHSNDGPVWAVLASALLQQNKLDDALGAADQAVKFSPDYGFGYRIKGDSLLILNRAAEARLALDKAIELGEKNGPVFRNRSFALEAMREYDAALHDAEVAIALDPKDAWAHYLKGINLVDKGQFRPAIDSFDTALRLVPDNPDIQRAVQKKKDEAQAALDRQVAEAKQEEAQRELADSIRNARREGYGVIALDDRGGAICYVRGTEGEGWLSAIGLGDRSDLRGLLFGALKTLPNSSDFDPLVGELKSFEDMSALMAAVQQKQCGSVLGSSLDLKDALVALEANGNSYHVLARWITPEEFNRATTQLVAQADNAKKAKSIDEGKNAEKWDARMDPEYNDPDIALFRKNYNDLIPGVDIEAAYDPMNNKCLEFRAKNFDDNVMSPLKQLYATLSLVETRWMVSGRSAAAKVGNLEECPTDRLDSQNGMPQFNDPMVVAEFALMSSTNEFIDACIVTPSAYDKITTAFVDRGKQLPCVAYDYLNTSFKKTLGNFKK